MTQNPMTVDDYSLLRAIVIEEGRVSTSPGGVPSAIKAMVLEHESFQVIRENNHLRALLRAYLEANIAVDSKARDVMRENAKGIIGRIIGGKTSRLKSLQDELAILKAIRDEAYKPYEMLRKLTDNDNVLLKRPKA